MKNILLITLLFMASQPIFASIGCMDNSWHLKKSPDYKTYHYVKCNCPCERYTLMENRGKCLRCGHFHNPQDINWIIESKKNESLSIQKFTVYFNSMQLFNNYKEEQGA